jgi:hypothetical protein
MMVWAVGEFAKDAAPSNALDSGNAERVPVTTDFPPHGSSVIVIASGDPDDDASLVYAQILVLQIPIPLAIDDLHAVAGAAGLRPGKMRVDARRRGVEVSLLVSPIGGNARRRRRRHRRSDRHGARHRNCHDRRFAGRFDIGGIDGGLRAQLARKTLELAFGSGDVKIPGQVIAVTAPGRGEFVLYRWGRVGRRKHGMHRSAGFGQDRLDARDARVRRCFRSYRRSLGHCPQGRRSRLEYDDEFWCGTRKSTGLVT